MGFAFHFGWHRRPFGSWSALEKSGPPVRSVCTLADMEQVLGRRTRLDVNDWAAGLAKTVDVESLLKCFNLLRIP